MTIKLAQSDLDFILLQLRLPNNQPVLPIDMTGIRDVSGVGNNVNFPSWGATDTPFARLFAPDFANYTPYTFSMGGPGLASSYATRDIDLQDATPRQISNIVNNSAGLTTLELQDNPLDTPGGRLNPLTGLVNPLVYSGYLSLVGQFFDHGLDFVQKGDDGFVVIKLDRSDSLFVEGGPNFMMISRTNTVHVDINEGSTDSLISALGLLEQRYTSVNPTTVVVGVDADGNNITRAASFVQGTNTITPTGLINAGAAGVFQLNNVAINIVSNSTGDDLIAAINAQSDHTGVVASINADKLQLTYLNGESINRISPFIDLSQQYGSVASQTAFLREYDNAGHITGSLAGHAAGPGLGMATWADIKANALNVGVILHDMDVFNIPEVRLTATGSPYLGTAGAQEGMWLVARDRVTGDVYYVKNSDIDSNAAGDVLTANGAVVSDLSILSSLKLQVVNHAFLDDIAHGLFGFDSEGVPQYVDNQGDIISSYTTTYQNISDPAHVVKTVISNAALLAQHYVAGDGRTNENIGLTSIHDIFHSEHEKVLDDLIALDAQRHLNDVTYIQMTGEELFQAAKLVVEMEYQHMIFGEFARKLSPNIGAFAAYDPTQNPAISQEFANAVYRLGHSMLAETIDTAVLNNGLKETTNYELFDVFLNPTAYAALNGDGTGLSAAGQIATGMSSQTGMAIDQWVTDTLRNKLVGLPLDLAAANITRGRDSGLPTFEEARDAVYAQTGMIQFARHETWYDFGANLIHPETVVDFIEAYADLTGIDGANRHQQALNALDNNVFMSNNQDFRKVDLWVGGLAEAKETNGMLGTLFDFVFATQMAQLQNNDRFYYLGRLVGTELLAQIESQLLVDIVQRNSGATHLYNDIFSVADSYVEMSEYAGKVTHFLNASDGSGADAGYAANGAFYGDSGNYYDARGVLSPNGKGKSSEMIGGTSVADKIFSLDGNDTVWADGGDDTVDGGNGNDFIHGGDGNDKLDDFGGDDFMWGEAGKDTINGGAGLDQIFGGDGNDDLYGSDGADIMDGGSDNDLIYGDFGISTALSAGSVAQYLHFDRVLGTAYISTVKTAGANESVQLLNANLDANGGGDIMGGGVGNDVLFGGGGGDALDGGDGNDTLMGGGGADAYLGGLGNDLFLADANDFAFNNTMDGSEGFDTVSYQLSVRAVSISLANAGLAIVPPGTNVLDSFINVEGLIGTTFNDTLVGSDFNNIIEGLAGNDSIDGGLGMDMVSYRNASLNRGVTINLNTAIQSNTAAGVGVDTLVNIEGVVGTNYNDNFTGHTLDNTFEGLAGNDTLSGGLGNDTASYITASASANLTINLGGTGATVGTGTTNTNLVQVQSSLNGNTALAEVGSDVFTSIENVIGGSGNDRIIGNGAANVIDGGPAGNDSLNGGAGIDTLSYASSLSSVIVNLSTNSARGSGTDTISNFENVTGSDYNDSLTGDANANVIIGGLGDDAMYGLAGNDMYVIRDAAEMGANELISDVGANTGTGDEIRYTQVVVTAGLPLAASTLTLSDRISGVERVVIEAGLGVVTYSITGVVTGSAGIAAVNVDASAVTAAPIIIVGNAGNNILGGTSSAGNDTLVGGLGNDTYVVDRATDVILEGNALITEIDTVNVDYKTSGTYVLGANLENGTVVSADTTLLVNITGNASANILTGNAGDNVLNGLAGIDTMLGGLGNDTYVVDNAADVVLENFNEGTDTIAASITYTLAGLLDVENLTLTGAAAINGTGNDLDNVITGNGAINTLNGGLGNDTLAGGAGNDIYVVDSLLDVIIENAGEGTDTVQSAFTYVLSTANVENLTLTGSAANGTGNSGNNIITGNGGANTLDGGLGIDTLIGGGGNDDYIIDDIFDSVVEAANAGTDTVHSYISYTLATNFENLTLKGTSNNNATGNAANNVITGNIGNNQIIGNDGTDTLIGGLGADSLQGGNGADRFTYTSSADSTIASRDMIMDFTRGALNTGDRIDLSGIDANSIGGTGNDAFLATMLNQGTVRANFTLNSQLRYWNDGVNTYLEGNTDGNVATAEFSVALVGVITTLNTTQDIIV